MKLQLEKFGKTLLSRELGSEAFKAFQVTLHELPKDEDLEIDFDSCNPFQCNAIFQNDS